MRISRAIMLIVIVLVFSIFFYFFSIRHFPKIYATLDSCSTLCTKYSDYSFCVSTEPQYATVCRDCLINNFCADTWDEGQVCSKYCSLYSTYSSCIRGESDDTLCYFCQQLATCSSWTPSLIGSAGFSNSVLNSKQSNLSLTNEYNLAENYLTYSDNLAFESVALQHQLFENQSLINNSVNYYIVNLSSMIQSLSLNESAFLRLISLYPEDYVLSHYYSLFELNKGIISQVYSSFSNYGSLSSGYKSGIESKMYLWRKNHKERVSENAVTLTNSLENHPLMPLPLVYVTRNSPVKTYISSNCEYAIGLAVFDNVIDSGGYGVDPRNGKLCKSLSGSMQLFRISKDTSAPNATSYAYYLDPRFSQNKSILKKSQTSLTLPTALILHTDKAHSDYDLSIMSVSNRTKFEQFVSSSLTGILPPTPAQHADLISDELPFPLKWWILLGCLLVVYFGLGIREIRTNKVIN